MVLDKIHELVREGRYADALPDYNEFQYQLRMLIYYGLLTRSDDPAD